MSDDPTVPEGTQEAAEAADGSSPPPWGDDFNPERAWRTIQHLRDFEKDAKAYKRLHEDEDAQREFLAQLGYEVADDEEVPDELEELEEDYEDYDDDEDPTADLRARIEDIDGWRQEQQVANAQRQFEEHLQELSKDEPELSDFEVNAVLHASLAGGFTPKATEEAYKMLLAERERLAKQAVENYRKSKKAPHVPSVGQSATSAPNLDNEGERHQYMRERLAAMENDS